MIDELRVGMVAIPYRETEVVTVLPRTEMVYDRTITEEVMPDGSIRATIIDVAGKEMPASPSKMLLYMLIASRRVRRYVDLATRM